MVPLRGVLYALAFCAFCSFFRPSVFLFRSSCFLLHSSCFVLLFIPLSLFSLPFFFIPPFFPLFRLFFLASFLLVSLSSCLIVFFPSFLPAFLSSLLLLRILAWVSLLDGSSVANFPKIEYRGNLRKAKITYFSFLECFAVVFLRWGRVSISHFRKLPKKCAKS